MSRANGSEIIRFPASSANADEFAKLDQFVLDELAPHIGYMNGAYALHIAGIQWIGELICYSEVELQDIPGIGKKKIEKLQQYLASRGLSLGHRNEDWLRYRHLRPLPGQRRQRRAYF